jgi:hypothetical protein
VLVLLVEVLCVLAVAVGVGLIYLPAGIIVGGLLGVLACEIASARRAAAARTDQPVRAERPA